MGDLTKLETGGTETAAGQNRCIGEHAIHVAKGNPMKEAVHKWMDRCLNRMKKR